MGRKLSKAQQAFMEMIDRVGKNERFFVGRDAGRNCRAWDRTCESLVRLGLVERRGSRAFAAGSLSAPGAMSKAPAAREASTPTASIAPTNPLTSPRLERTSEALDASPRHRVRPTSGV